MSNVIENATELADDLELEGRDHSAKRVHDLLAIVRKLPVTADGVPIQLGMTLYYRATFLKGVPIHSYRVGQVRHGGGYTASGGRCYEIDQGEPVWSSEQLARQYHAEVKAKEAGEAAQAAREASK